MSKQLLLNFNQDGSLSQSQSTGSAIRQGDSNGEVTLVATFQNRRNDAYVAKLHFERPDGKKQRNIVMTPSASQLNQFDYSFLSGWFFAVAGTAKVTVTITDSNGAVSAQGSYSFAVEPTQVDVVDSTITYDEAAELEGLIANSIKRAKTVTLGQNVGVAGFYAACLSYLGDSAILDGDRFVGTTTNQSLNQSTNFFGEFVGDDKMLVIAKKRTYPTPVSLTISHSVYVVSGGAQSPTITEMVDSEKLSSLFDGTAAKKAVADQNGHVIDWTYATKAEVVAANNVGYIKIDDENEDENGNLTAAQVAEANKDVCFIQYTNNSEGTMMFVSYYFGGTDRFFWSLMTNTLESGEPNGTPWAYRFKQARIILWDIDDPTSATWQFNEDDDVHVTHEPEEGSTDLITSGGVYDAVSALDSKISKNAEDIAALTEALIKKDLYETQEATFQGMTAVPAGALVKAYLDGFKGNSAVVNQLVNMRTNSPTVISIDSTYEFSVLVADTEVYVRPDVVFQQGHVYLINSQKSGTFSKLQYFTNDSYDYSISLSDGVFPRLITYNNANGSNGTIAVNGAVGSSCKLNIIDLTLAGLTSAEMADVATAKAALKHKDMDVDSYIPYNAGTLTDSKPTKLISHGYNLFDGELQFGGYSDNGSWIGSQVIISNKNPIIVKGGVQYTFSQHNFTDATQKKIVQFDASGNFITSTYASSGSANLTITTQPNAHHIYLQFAKSSAYSSLPTDPQLCFHLASADLGYKPYVPPIEYDLTMPNLKSAGSVQDESKAGGELVGKVDLDDLVFSYSSGTTNFTSNSPADSADIVSGGTIPILCDKYAMTTAYNIYTSPVEKTICMNGGYWTTGKAIVVHDTSLNGDATLVSGNLNYAKAAATDFTDLISYPEIFNVYAGGSIEVVGEGLDATTKVYFYVEA